MEELRPVFTDKLTTVFMNRLKAEYFVIYRRPLRWSIQKKYKGVCEDFPGIENSEELFKRPLKFYTL